MYRGIPTHRNGPVPTINDLPLEDEIGSVRKVSANGKLYINTGKNLDVSVQWREWNATAKAIVGGVVDTSQFVRLDDNATFTGVVSFSGVLNLNDTTLSMPAEEPPQEARMWVSGGDVKLT